MSTLMSGINSINSLSTQIAALQSGQEVDPESIQLTLQQNFNDMLDGLISSSNDDDEDDDSSFDPFLLMNNSNVQIENNPLALQGYMLDVNKL